MQEQQLSLSFAQLAPPEIGRARRRDPLTSKEAARRMNPESLQGQIVQTLQASDHGLTIEQLSRRLRRKEISVSPRLRELERKGLIYRSGRRANISGLEAIVWKALQSYKRFGSDAGDGGSDL